MKLQNVHCERWQSMALRQIVVPLIAVTAVCFSGAHSAQALVTIWSNVDPDGNGHEIDYDEETDSYYLVEYWYDNIVDVEVIQEVPPLGYPSEDGSSTGLGPDDHTWDLMLEQLKKIGGSPFQTPDPLDSPFGRQLVESGKVPGAEIDPWDNTLFMEGPDGTGGGGGFDPNLPIGEQIDRKKRQGSSDDDDDDDNGDGEHPWHFGGFEYPADPELVNPAPRLLFQLLLALTDPGNAAGRIMFLDAISD